MKKIATTILLIAIIITLIIVSFSVKPFNYDIKAYNKNNPLDYSLVNIKGIALSTGNNYIVIKLDVTFKEDTISYKTKSSSDNIFTFISTKRNNIKLNDGELYLLTINGDILRQNINFLVVNYIYMTDFGMTKSELTEFEIHK